MGADLLREAAAAIRADYTDHTTAEFENAIADWLEAEADEIPPHATHYRDGLLSDAPAVRVASAYLNP